MSAEGNTPAAPAPSVFISYASEDRAAARALRDALLAVGLDVWYDENELTGGDAWDQKIRRQIRDCEYFMPVISATTERRKEGYFRREWRLAAERTLDMADDVLFLVPVTIDETSESSARVPDKFMTVQWLRAPGGQRNPALDALALRLLAGEHHIAPRRSGVTAPPIMMGNRPPAPAEPAHAPPKMPEFPHPPEKGGVGHWLKFMAEVIWWMVTATWTVFMRLPRWVRIILGLWLIFMLISTCSRDSDLRQKGKKHPDGPTVAEVERAASATAEQIAAVLEKNANPKDWGKIGDELARRFGGPAERVPSGSGKKTLVFAPFAPDPENAKATQFAQNAFSRCYGQIILARRNEVAISPVMPVGSSDEALAALGQQQRADFVLGTQLTKSPEGERKLVVRLIHTKDGAVTWSAEYHAGGDAREVGAKIAETILQQLPPPQPPRKKG